MRPGTGGAPLNGTAPGQPDQSVAATASSTEEWIGKTLVRPVIRKIFRMRS